MRPPRFVAERHSPTLRRSNFPKYGSADTPQCGSTSLPSFIPVRCRSRRSRRSCLPPRRARPSQPTEEFLGASSKPNNLRNDVYCVSKWTMILDNARPSRRILRAFPRPRFSPSAPTDCVSALSGVDIACMLGVRRAGNDVCGLARASARLMARWGSSPGVTTGWECWGRKPRGAAGYGGMDGAEQSVVGIRGLFASGGVAPFLDDRQYRRCGHAQGARG